MNGTSGNRITRTPFLIVLAACVGVTILWSASLPWN